MADKHGRPTLEEKAKAAVERFIAIGRELDKHMPEGEGDKHTDAMLIVAAILSTSIK